MSKLKVFILTASTVAMTVAFQNCSQEAFNAASSNNQTGTNPTIRQFQPALAVRDISCLACHANVQANIITDFGYNDPWYLNQNGPQAASGSFGSYHYMANTWQTLEQVKGQVIVPEANVPSQVVDAAIPSGTQPPSGNVDLSTYLTMTNVIVFSPSWESFFHETPATHSLTNNVQPPSGQSAVISESNIYIGAPTVKEILALVPSNSHSAPWVQAVGASSAGVSGLSTAHGVSGTDYVTNNGAIQCSNQDVVINGTLLLSNARIFAEKGGCRLYVTGSVFIEGPITYLDSGASADPTDNLQITSAKSINMGVGLQGNVVNGQGSVYSTAPLHNRLLDDARGNMVLRSAPTSASYNTMAQSILAEAQNIGSTLLVDASNPAGLPTASSAAGQTRAVVNYKHVLLNAPLIHSRYLGTVSGVIVAESALFSLGEFSFNYDPIFQNVQVLPALPQDILCAGNSSSGCTPANP